MAPIAVWIVLVVAATAGAAVPRVDARAAEDGLRFESHTVYRLDPVADAVNVTVELSVTNEVPDPPGGSFYYYDNVWVPVPGEATSVTATSDDGGGVGVSLEPSDLPTWRQASIAIAPVLRYGQTRSFTLTFTLPGLAPRSEGLTRVNDAAATFLAVAHGDPGLASVDVFVPASLDSEVVGADMQARVDGDVRVYSAAGIAEPDQWAASVIARDAAALVGERVEIADRAIDVRAWPGDTAWSDFVSGQVEAGLPVLDELIGLPWPAPADGLDVVESVAPLAHGFGGWYDPTRNVIEIGDELDQHLVFHELSHLWFNGDLFDQRWILEGLAEEYGSRVVADLAGPVLAPETLPPDHPGALPLNGWNETDVARDALTVQREQFAYTTAWAVVRRLVDEIGEERMAGVLEAAADDRIAYQGDPDAERFSGPADWTRFLDLLEELGGSTGADTLFASTIVTPDQHPALDARRIARAAYEDVEAAGGEWTPPLALRQAMAGWDFEQAATLTEVSSDVLSARSQITDAVRPLGLEAPERLETAYESGDGDLSAVTAMASDTLDAARELAATGRAVEADRNVLETVGLLGRDVDTEFDAAVGAFEDGELDAAADQSDAVADVLDDASATGTRRVAIVGGALILALLVVVIAARLGRGTRKRPPAAA